MSEFYKVVGKFGSTPIFVSRGSPQRPTAPPVGFYKNNGMYGFGFDAALYDKICTAGVGTHVPTLMMKCIIAMRDHKTVEQRRYFCSKLCSILMTVFHHIPVDSDDGKFFFDILCFYMQPLSKIYY